MSQSHNPFSSSGQAEPADGASAASASVSWRHRALRRFAGSVGAAVVLAGVGPAVANAAGADVANPVVIALRASGKGLKATFGSSDESAPCVTPTGEPSSSVDPSGEPSVSPSSDVPTVDPSLEPSVDPSAGTADPSATPSDVGTPSTSPESTESVDPSASAEPTLDPSASVVPSVDTSSTPDDDCVDTESTPSPSPSEAPASEDGAHGKLVSTVAHCAPKGKDPLLDVEGAPANHGGYVRVAAHGESLTTPWGTFDLSTQAGADALCTALEAARAALPEPTAATKSHGKKDKGEHGRPDKAKAGKDHAKHGATDDGDDAESDDSDAGTDDSSTGS